MSTETVKITIRGVLCEVRPTIAPDGKYVYLYTFTCPGWDECTVTGRRAAERVIRGRTDPAVLNTLGKAVPHA